MNFTDEQIRNWHAYEKVREYGRYNMFDPRARALTGLNLDDYLFCLENYSALKQAALSQQSNQKDEQS